MTKFKAHAAAASICCFSWLGTAHAGLPSALHHMVTAPSCQPVTDSDRDRLELSNGAWVFRNGEDEFAMLYCPISFYGSVGQFNNLQLWYVDDYDETPPYGFANYGYVEAKLMSRSRTQPGATLVAAVASNDGQLGYNYVNEANVPGGPTTGKSYYVELRMYREHPNADVAFVALAIDIQ
jgi:hypothetical protein